MKNILAILLIILLQVYLINSSNAQEILGAWEMNGLTTYGSSPYAASTSSANMTIGGLTRGGGITTSGLASADAWGGTGMEETSFADALAANDFVSFTLEPNAGYVISLTQIAPYNIRRSATGSTTGQWQYQVGAGSFIDVGSPITWGGTTTAAGNTQQAIDLSEISDLQFLTNGTIITFRIVLWGASATVGTWYFNDFQGGNDFVIEGTENNYWNGGNIAASPADGGTGDWSTTNAWRTITASGSQATWSANKSAVLAGTAGNVNIDADIVASKIILNTTNYIFYAGATRTLTSKISLANNINLNLFDNSTTGNQTLNFVGNILAGSNAALTLRATATGANVTRFNLGSGGSLNLTCFAPITVTGSGIASIANGGTGSSASSTYIGNITGNSSRLHLGANNGFTSIFSGTINNTGGDIRITSASSGGAGVVVISGVGNVWNNTFLNNANSGVLRIEGGNNRLPTSTTLTFGETTGNGASTFDLNGLNQTIGALTNGTQAGGTITNSQSATTSVLTIGGATSPAAFSGSIQNGAGTIEFVRVGSGATQLTGQSTYTGLTTVSGGSLILNHSAGNTLPIGNNVLIEGGTLRISSNQTLNNVTITSGVLEVDMGVVLTINGTFNFTGGTLTINGTIAYGGSSTLHYGTGTNLNVGNEWPSSNSPNNITIASGTQLTLLSDRSIGGSLTLSSGFIVLQTNHLLVNAIVGGSPTAYIITNSSGTLRADVSTTAFLFPVGNAAYNPVTITNNTGSDDIFSVRIVDEVLDGGTSGKIVTGPHVDRTWDISKANSNGGSGVDFVFEWNSGEINGTISSAALYHFSSGSWSKETSGSVGSTATSLTYTGYMGTFSPFAIGDNLIILPVSLVGFNANFISTNYEVFIEWQTASEVNNHFFEIERSQDLEQWYSIGFVEGKGNSFEINSYSFKDKDITHGVYYYRLKQVDLDGKSTFSLVREVLVNSPLTTSQIIIYPNPAHTFLYINLPENQRVSIKIYSITGIQIYSEINVFNNQVRLDLKGLEKGVYLLYIDNNSLIEVKKFFVE